MTDPMDPAPARRGRPFETDPRGYSAAPRALVAALRAMIVARYGTLKAFWRALAETGNPIKYQELSRQLSEPIRFPNGPHRHVVTAIVDLCDPDRREAINALVANVDAEKGSATRSDHDRLSPRSDTQAGIEAGPASGLAVHSERDSRTERMGVPAAQAATDRTARRPSRSWRRSRAVVAAVLGTIVGLIIVIPGWISNTTQQGDNPGGLPAKLNGCSVQGGVPLAVLGSARSNSPRLQRTLLLDELLKATSVGEAHPPREVVQVDARPSVKMSEYGDYTYDSGQFVIDFVSASYADDNEVDLLAALDVAARSLHSRGTKGIIAIFDSGLSTTGLVDFSGPGALSAQPFAFTSYLTRTAGLLPDLRGITVFLTGIGDTAPPQPPLDAATRKNLRSVWTSIAMASGADCVGVNDEPQTGPARNDAPPVKTVAVPELATFDPTRPAPLVLAGDVLTGFQPQEGAFQPDTAVLYDPVATQARLVPVAGWLSADRSRSATVQGTTAREGGEAAQLGLSKARADQIAAILVRLGVAKEQVTSVGLGSHFDGYIQDHDAAGQLLPGPASQNKSVRIFIN